MPPPSVWGPFLWKVLHGIGDSGYRLAPSVNPFHKDQEREAIWILTHLEYCIPCKECIDHVFQFKKKVPVPKSSATIQDWICALHNSVNEKLGKDTIDKDTVAKDTVEGVTGCVSRTSVLDAWKEYLATIQDSILLGQVSGPHLREFKRHMLLWLQYSST